MGLGDPNRAERAPEGEPVDGLVVVDKPAGITSHDVVARCRRIFGQRRVGHGGTLDPDATGVLLVGLGQATRLLRFLSGLSNNGEEVDTMSRANVGVVVNPDRTEVYAPPRTGTGNITENAFTPKVSLQFQLDPANLFYTTYAKGFRPGGANNPIPNAACPTDFANFGIQTDPPTFSSDSVKSFEVGAKSVDIRRNSF